MLETIQSIVSSVDGLIGISPILIIPVFVLVSLFAWLLRVRTLTKQWKNFWLGVLCLAVGCAVALLGDGEGIKELARDGFVLGSISALSYQILKGLFGGVKDLVKDKVETATEVELEIEDNDVL